MGLFSSVASVGGAVKSVTKVKRQPSVASAIKSVGSVVSSLPSSGGSSGGSSARASQRTTQAAQKTSRAALVHQIYASKGPTPLQKLQRNNQQTLQKLQKNPLRVVPHESYRVHAALYPKSVPAQVPKFSGEGPQFYHAAFKQNQRWGTTGGYQTKLPPAQERNFEKWAQQNRVPFNPTAKHVDYDMRGYYKATGGKPHKAGTHFPDTFKTPLDTTFSNQSKYAKPGTPFVWRGNNLVNKNTGVLISGGTPALSSAQARTNQKGAQAHQKAVQQRFQRAAHQLPHGEPLRQLAALPPKSVVAGNPATALATAAPHKQAPARIPVLQKAKKAPQPALTPAFLAKRRKAIRVFNSPSPMNPSLFQFLPRTEKYGFHNIDQPQPRKTPSSSPLQPTPLDKQVANRHPTSAALAKTTQQSAQAAAKRNYLLGSLASVKPAGLLRTQVPQLRGTRFSRHGPGKLIAQQNLLPIGNVPRKYTKHIFKGAPKSSAKVHQFLGAPTLGTPHLGNLWKLAKKGQLNKVGGRTATPQAAQALLKLHKLAPKQGFVSSPNITKQQGAAAVYAANLVHKLYPGSPKIDPRLLVATTGPESTYGRSTLPGVHSGTNSATATGPSQILTSNLNILIPDLAQKGVKITDPHDWKQSMILQARYWQVFDPSGTAQSNVAAAFESHYNHLASEASTVAQDTASMSVKPGKPAHPQALARAIGAAKNLGIPVGKGGKVPAPLSPGGTLVSNKPTPQQATRFKAIVAGAKKLEKLQLPYVWGGGHTSPAQIGSGMDCSGTVSWVLQHAGYKVPTFSTATFESAAAGVIAPGPGKVTIFNDPSSHIFMRIGKHYFGTSGSNPGGGAGFIATSYESGEAHSGKYNVWHLKGLGGKTSLGGFGGTGGSNFPGMTLSSTGTTASINSGAGVVQAKPGPSNRPIKFASQSALKKLKSVGINVLGGPSPTQPKVDLRDLERKYG